MLNAEQKQMVETTEGPVLVIAGAGSGKTMAITHRIAHLIKKGVDPSRILLLTFTNRAADEMKERAVNLVGPEASRVEGSTYHSFCAKVLRKYAPLLGLDSSFTVINPSSTRIALDLIKDELGYSDQKGFLRANQLADIISYSTNKGYSLEGALLVKAPGKEDNLEDVEKIAKRYKKYKKDNHLVDFDDLLILTNKLLSENKKVRKALSDHFQYIMVDEYQDSNHLQMTMLKLLRSFDNKNLCVVGDESQCLPGGEHIDSGMFEVRIEDAYKGLNLDSFVARGRIGLCEVKNKNKRAYTGDLIGLELESGNKTRLTPSHIVFADKDFDDKYFLALYIDKKGTYYLKVEEKKFIDKTNSFWILRTSNRKEDLEVFGTRLSLVFHLPFNTKDSFKEKISFSENIDNGDELLEAMGLFKEYPYVESESKNIKISSVFFGGKQDEKHILKVFSQKALDLEDFKEITDIKHIHYNHTYHFESMEYGEIEDRLFYLHDLLKDEDYSQEHQAELVDYYRLSLVPASHLLVGNKLCTLDEGSLKTEKLSQIRKESYKGYVYDIDTDCHNYSTNKILVHNCIYGFRGSEFKNILNFPKDFPGTKKIVLNKNYRSNQEILDVANKLMSRAKEGFKKNLLAHKGSAEQKPYLVDVYNQYEEADFVLYKIKKGLEEGKSLSDFAVLVRNANDSNLLEYKLQAEGLPFKKFGGKKFIDKDSVQTFLALLNVISNKKDELSWIRVLKLIPGIGSVTAQRISHDIGENGIEILLDEKYKNRRYGNDLESFYKIYNNICNIRDVSDKVELALSEYGKIAEYSINASGQKQSSKEETLSYLENDLRQMELFIDIAGSYSSLPSFLESFLLDSNTEDLSGEYITISTVHSAKGLEFNTVFILEVIEGRFPSASRIQGDSDIALKEMESENENERRLFYVAITRAKDELYLMVPELAPSYGGYGNLAEESVYLLEGNLGRRLCEPLSVQ